MKKKKKKKQTLAGYRQSMRNWAVKRGGEMIAEFKDCGFIYDEEIQMRIEKDFTEKNTKIELLYSRDFAVDHIPFKQYMKLSQQLFDELRNKLDVLDSLRSDYERKKR